MITKLIDKKFFVKHAPFLLPFLSAALLILSFYPFKIYILSFVALIPLFHFIYFTPSTNKTRAFWGGLIVGSMFSTSISFFTLMQFNWLPETYLFIWITRLLFIPIAIVTGFIAGLSTVFLKKIQSKSVNINIFAFASVWVLVEYVVSVVFAGFHYGLLAYTSASIPFLIQLSSIGGTYFVSFLIVMTNGFVSSIFYFSTKSHADNAFESKLRKVFLSAIVVSVLLITVFYANKYYLYKEVPEATEVSFAIIQIQDRRKGAFGDFVDGEFSFPKLENIIKTANKFNPDIITYPFSSFVGVISSSTNPSIVFDRKVITGNFESMGKWVSKNVNKNSVFLTWNNVLRDRSFYNEFNFWKDGELISYYQKRDLFPFMDYTPKFAQKINLFSTPFDVEWGSYEQRSTLGDMRVSNLICSEVNKSSITRKDGAWANIFISIGSEAMFRDSVAGDLNLINAQFRAAENNRPIVRDDRLGPSAIIDRDGSIIDKMDFGEEGVLFKKIEIEKDPKRTFYSFTGDLLFIFILILFLVGITYKKRKAY